MLPLYSQLQQFSNSVIAMRRCNSENSLTGHTQYSETDNTKPHLQLQVGPNNQPSKSVNALCNPVTADHTNNNRSAHILHVSKCNDSDHDEQMDIVSSKTHPSYVCINNNKI